MRKILLFALIGALLSCGACATASGDLTTTTLSAQTESDTSKKSQTNMTESSEQPDTTVSAKAQTVVFKNTWVQEDTVTVFLGTQYEPTYYFILTSDKKLVTIQGLSTTDYAAGDSVQADGYAEKTLTNEEWEDLSYVVTHFGEFEDFDIVINDVWTAFVSLNDEEYSYIYGLSKNSMYDLFVAKLIRYSGLPVLDSQGEHVKPMSVDELAEIQYVNR